MRFKCLQISFNCSLKGNKMCQGRKETETCTRAEKQKDFVWASEFEVGGESETVKQCHLQCDNVALCFLAATLKKRF